MPRAPDLGLGRDIVRAALLSCSIGRAKVGRSRRAVGLVAVVAAVRTSTAALLSEPLSREWPLFVLSPYKSLFATCDCERTDAAPKYGVRRLEGCSSH